MSVAQSSESTFIPESVKSLTPKATKTKRSRKSPNPNLKPITEEIKILLERCYRTGLLQTNFKTRLPGITGLEKTQVFFFLFSFLQTVFLRVFLRVFLTVFLKTQRAKNFLPIRVENVNF